MFMSAWCPMQVGSSPGVRESIVQLVERLVWAVHIFRPYLYGKRFTLRTDHNCLKWLHNFNEPEGQVARQLEAFAEFDNEVVHRPGKQHQMQMLCHARCVSNVGPQWVGKK